ncbi:thiopeptide-type bacteriocin biosynthesis protein [Streptosporangium subroseum]|uniref:thiopeptide-type bacteriocin biosynthesis protein n=1 Tax=Streptosporangium subroseum TaxID=106412 RepID=UPI00308F19F5|nr:thiopeptide-type bacteriocin biosynthesis protein [Streptosporangium subroseum]
MPADHLTIAPPYQLANGVLQILAGADVEAAAAETGVDPGDLHESLQVYQAAGLTALERRADTHWYQVRVQFADWSTAETIGATQLGPRLDELQAGGAVAGWWFLRKHPCWRLRLYGADTTAVDHVLDELTAAGLLTRWWPTVYEPETAAFGGAAGMGAAHDLFCADSRGVLDYARRSEPGLGRRELSILLISALMRAAGLDWFERGDVFDRVARLRPTPDVGDARLEELAGRLCPLLASSVPADSPLLAPGGPIAFAVPWLAAYQAAGHRLGDAATQGRLDRGVRAVLTHAVIFHWNRFGLSATTQGVLAHAASTAILPRS